MDNNKVVLDRSSVIESPSSRPLAVGLAVNQPDAYQYDRSRKTAEIVWPVDTIIEAQDISDEESRHQSAMVQL